MKTKVQFAKPTGIKAETIDKMPRSGKLVPVKSLLSAREAKSLANCAAVFVELDGQMYSVRPNDSVPGHASVLRQSSGNGSREGQIVGIAAVTGG